MKRAFILLFLTFIVLEIASADYLDVVTTVPEDFGIVFPEAIHLDRLYFAMANEEGELELITEPDIDAGILWGDTGSMEISLLYYGNLAEPYAVDVYTDVGDGFRLATEGFGTYIIPITPVFSMPELTEGVLATVSLSEEEDSAALIIRPSGPIRGGRVLDLVLNWEGGRDLLPGDYVADISIALMSE